MLQVGIIVLKYSQRQPADVEIFVATISTGSFCVNRTSVDGQLGGHASL